MPMPAPWGKAWFVVLDVIRVTRGARKWGDVNWQFIAVIVGAVIRRLGGKSIVVILVDEFHVLLAV